MFDLIFSQATDAGFEGIAGAYRADLPDALYFASGETNLWITPMAGTISVELDARWCKINETMPAGDLLNWLNSKPIDTIAAEFSRAGINIGTMFGCAVQRINGIYSVENELAKCSKMVLDDAIYYVRLYFGWRSLLSTNAVSMLIKDDLRGCTLEDGWYVYGSNSAYRVKLTEQFGETKDLDKVSIVVGIGSMEISETFSRENIDNIRDFSGIVILRDILNLSRENNRRADWIRNRVCDISNYAQVSAALAAIGYGLMRTERDSPTVEKYASGLSKSAAVVIIEITSVYELCVCCGDEDDRETTFPFGTDPAEIITWILEQQPIYADLLRLHDKLTAAKTEIRTLKNVHAKIRAAIQ